MLDVLFKIKDEMDPTLAFRRSCRCALVQPSLYIKPCRHICVQSARGLCCSKGPYKSCRVQGGHLWVLRHEHQRHKWASMLDKGEHGPTMCMLLLVFH